MVISTGRSRRSDSSLSRAYYAVAPKKRAEGRKEGREGGSGRASGRRWSFGSLVPMEADSKWKKRRGREKRSVYIYIYMRFVFFSNSSVPRTRGHRGRGAQSREEKWKKWKKVACSGKSGTSGGVWKWKGRIREREIKRRGSRE